MISLDYVFYHVERVLRMMRGDASALDEMDISADGFWRSFSAILFALPALFFMWVEGAQNLIKLGSDLTMGQILLLKAPIDLIAWILPFLIYPLALKLIGREQYYSHLVIALNWANLVLYYVVAAFIFVAFLLPQNEALGLIFALILFAILVGSLIVLAQIVKACLKTSTTLAAAFIFVEIVAIYALAYSVEGLAGLHVTPMG